MGIKLNILFTIILIAIVILLIPIFRNSSIKDCKLNEYRVKNKDAWFFAKQKDYITCRPIEKELEKGWEYFDKESRKKREYWVKRRMMAKDKIKTDTIKNIF
jgi:hypothetical protein